MKSKFLDDGVGEHLAGDALHFGARSARIELTIQPQHKIFTLPDVLNPLILHLFESVMDSLTLWIKDGLLEGYVDMSLHRARL